MTCFSFLFSRKLDSSSKFCLEVDEGIHNVNFFSYKELRRTTDDFSDSNKIGEGGFGSVYKARLKGGLHAAVKVLSATSSQGVDEFVTEIKVISKIAHENLVKLYGCCVEHDQRILVYNYLENNSLAHTLLGKNPNNIQFTWRTRYRIGIGVARGLAYLHDAIQPHIVHRDIKASNILLDRDLTPKISDFGLAKLIPANMTHVSTRVAGTLGYLAPEYAINGRLTRKADIYSFGVLLAEIVCGRNNTNTRLPVEEHYLLERVWELHERRELVGLVDASLKGDFDAEEACRFLKVSLLCTQDNPKHRPSMSTVVKMLAGEFRIDDDKIKKPILITDFMDLKVRGPPKPSDSKSTSYAASSASENQMTSNYSSDNSASGGGNMAFSGLFNRST
ncbi:cold-responsive protein kinase 1-like isoform X2 [Punica granatum]|uniref:Cold-responsive protein kinase 1-like isoform X2 n=1 Tax=Punica granatum TaxID=22663 RepID=A0A6P8C6Z6_PUNGR|nr:cold-responsive protein kinase 1-like isoform X2 [Punica granatum]